MEYFWFYIWVAVVWILILRHKWLRVTSYPVPMNMNKKLTANTSKYIPKFWERSVRRKSDLDFIRDIWSTFSIYMLQTFLKTLSWQFFVSRSERLFISSAILSCKICNLSTFLMLVCYNAKSFSLRSFSLMHTVVCSLH